MHVKMDAETRIMQLHAKEPLQPWQLEEARKDPLAWNLKLEYRF
jgi:hypothetical protein